MTQPVDRILSQRRQAAETSRAKGAWASLLLHGGCVGILLAAPLFQDETAEPLQIVSVALVSAQALGVAEPPPAPKRETPPTPAPAAETPKPRPRPTKPSATKPSTKPAPEPAPAADQLVRREGSASGSSTGTAALGARVGFDNPNFKHSYFVDRLVAMLSSQWQRPSLGGELLALVHFTIHRDGAVSDIRIVESSGYSSYDLAALRAVQQAAPFPPLPQSYNQGSLGVTVEFE